MLEIPVDAKPGQPRIAQKPMTLREAVTQAHMELGMSREAAELRAKASDAFLPDAAGPAQSPVKPGRSESSSKHSSSCSGRWMPILA